MIPEHEREQARIRRDAARQAKKDLKDRLFKEWCVEINTKAEKCFNLAWEYGHSGGLKEVESCFDEFVELILPD